LTIASSPRLVVVHHFSLLFSPFILFVAFAFVNVVIVNVEDADASPVDCHIAVSTITITSHPSSHQFMIILGGDVERIH
jgi:hypothetical protein